MNGADVVAAAATVTEPGTVRTFAMPPDSVRAAPVVGAAFARVTVHVVLELEVRDAAAHCSEETSTGATSEIVADLEELLREAVTVEL